MDEATLHDHIEMAAEDGEIVCSNYAIDRHEALSRLLGSVYQVADDGTTDDVRKFVNELSRRLGFTD